jgi:hypothetical protein
MRAKERNNISTLSIRPIFSTDFIKIAPSYSGIQRQISVCNNAHFAQLGAIFALIFPKKSIHQI